MINERSSAQPNTPTSANMQYGYPHSKSTEISPVFPNIFSVFLDHFDMMNMPTMQNPNDIYPYFPASLYQPFGTFDDHNQWGSADSSGNVPPQQAPIPFHPQMYTQSPLEIPRSPFDYPPHPPHAYPHYHHGYTPSTFPGQPSAGASVFDMPWNPHSLSMQQMQVAASQQMTPIGGGLASNKKPSVYDDYPAVGVGDMLAQHMNSVDLGSGATNDDAHNYDNGNNDNSPNVNALSAKEQQQQQQHYQSNTNNLSLSSRPSQPPQTSSSNGPKSYASVVSSDMINPNSNKPTSSASNNPLRSNVQSSTNERNDNPTPNFPTDSTNSRANTNVRGANNNNNTNYYSQQTRNGSGGYNSRNQQQQQSSASSGFQNWPNNNLPPNARGNNNISSTTYYNSGSSNYYDRSSYNQQHGTSANNKRQNSNYQQNYSSRTANSLSNGDDSASASGHQPASATSLELLETLKRNHQYNPKDFNPSPKGARFFVIKSVRNDTPFSLIISNLSSSIRKMMYIGR